MPDLVDLQLDGNAVADLGRAPASGCDDADLPSLAALTHLTTLI